MIDPVTLSRQLIKCQSITPDHSDAIEILCDLLEPIGFKCQKFIFDDPIYNAHVYNLYARFGTNGKNLCFAGHTDVVPIGDKDAWSVDPFAGIIKNELLYGRGTSDMKCAIACFVSAAIKFIKHHKDQFKGSISLLITGDEEGHNINGTPKVLEILKKQKEVLDICLLGEPTNRKELGEMIKIGRRGSLNAKLEVYGKQGHVAAPEYAHNPITDLLKAISILKNDPLDQGNKSFQPSNLEITSIDVGNNTCNVIPNKATAKFNIRFNDLHTSKQLISILKKRLDSININYNLITEVSGEAFVNYPQDFCELAKKAIFEVTGKNAALGTRGGTSDARFIHKICPTIEFGLVGNTAHQIDEHVAVKDLYDLTKIYEKIIEYYFYSN